MNDTTRHWYSIYYLEAGRHQAAYGSSILAEAELVASLETGNYLFPDDLIFWDCGRPKSMKDWSITDCDRIYINPTAIISITPMRDDPRNIINTVDDLPTPKTFRGYYRRFLQRLIEKLEKKQNE